MEIQRFTDFMVQLQSPSSGLDQFFFCTIRMYLFLKSDIAFNAKQDAPISLKAIEIHEKARTGGL